MTILDLNTFYHSTAETREQLQTRIDAGDFVLDSAINSTDFGAKCYAVAVIDPDYLGIAGTFRGETLPPGGLIVLAVQYGDANADGEVTLDDYAEWAANIVASNGQPAPMLDHWERGAFNGTHDTPGAPASMPNYLIWAGQFGK